MDRTASAPWRLLRQDSYRERLFCENNCSCSCRYKVKRMKEEENEKETGNDSDGVYSFDFSSRLRS